MESIYFVPSRTTSEAALGIPTVSSINTGEPQPSLQSQFEAMLDGKHVEHHTMQLAKDSCILCQRSIILFLVYTVYSKWINLIHNGFCPTLHISTILCVKSIPIWECSTLCCCATFCFSLLGTQTIGNR